MTTTTSATVATTKRLRMDRLSCIRRRQPIALAVDGSQQPFTEGSVDRIAQRVHVGTQHVAFRRVILPEFVLELLACPDAVRVLHEEQEYAARARIQLDGRAGALRAERVRVVAQGADLQDLRRWAAGRAPEQGLETRLELDQRKRL